MLVQTSGRTGRRLVRMAIALGYRRAAKEFTKSNKKSIFELI